MYFHPLILTEAQMQQRLAAWEDMASVCLAGVERQHLLHAEAFTALFKRHREGAKAIVKVMNLATELANWSALAVQMPLHLFPISMRSAEIAAKLHREIAGVADIYVSSPQGPSAEEPEGPNVPAGGSGAAHSRMGHPQMMA